MAKIRVGHYEYETKTLSPTVQLTHFEARTLVKLYGEDIPPDIIWAAQGDILSDTTCMALAKRNMIEGKITFEGTYWELNSYGKIVAKAVLALIEHIQKERRELKDDFKEKSFNEKVTGGYYSIDKETAKQFQADLFTEYGVIDNPKADRCFQIAWNIGHAYGYPEVYGYFGELVDLIR